MPIKLQKRNKKNTRSKRDKSRMVGELNGGEFHESVRSHCNAVFLYEEIRL